MSSHVKSVQRAALFSKMLPVTAKLRSGVDRILLPLKFSLGQIRNTAEEDACLALAGIINMLCAHQVIKEREKRSSVTLPQVICL